MRQHNGCELSGRGLFGQILFQACTFALPPAQVVELPSAQSLALPRTHMATVSCFWRSIPGPLQRVVMLAPVSLAQAPDPFCSRFNGDLQPRPHMIARYALARPLGDLNRLAPDMGDTQLSGILPLNLRRHQPSHASLGSTLRATLLSLAGSSTTDSIATPKHLGPGVGDAYTSGQVRCVGCNRAWLIRARRLKIKP